MIEDTNTNTNSQENKSIKYRQRIHLTVDPEAYAFLKSKGYNASRFFENAINTLRKEVRP